MGQGIDRKGAVPQQDRRQDESPEECRVAANREDRCAKQNCGHSVIFVQEPEFRKLLEILHAAAVIFTVLGRKNPSDMRPPDTSAYRRMEVLRGIRVAMMRAVMRRPPQHAHLHAGLSEKG